MSDNLKRYRIIVAPEPVGKHWIWTLESQGYSGWGLEETGRKRTRSSALAKARRRCDYWLFSILGVAQARTEEIHIAPRLVYKSPEPKQSPLAAEFTKDCPPR